MNTYTLLLLCVLVYVRHVSCEIKEECKEIVEQLRNEVNKMMDEGSAPSCIKECGLDAFRHTGEEEDRKEKMRQLKEYMESLEEDKMQEALECMVEIKEDLMKRMEGTDISEKCMENIEKQSEKIMEYIIGESEGK